MSEGTAQIVPVWLCVIYGFVTLIPRSRDKGIAWHLESVAEKRVNQLNTFAANDTFKCIYLEERFGILI